MRATLKEKHGLLRRPCLDFGPSGLSRFFHLATVFGLMAYRLTSTPKLSGFPELPCRHQSGSRPMGSRARIGPRFSRHRQNPKHFWLRMAVIMLADQEKIAGVGTGAKHDIAIYPMLKKQNIYRSGQKPFRIIT
ncbi:hypothetical protein LWE61_07680 [Sphingobium sufflavum]|uniref:hypothetical protein n=1 Tax=Sphingobium sufflavum TaxID=1129547 RepID=UPI001F1C39DB|nr:hypothetical protein [Sphingobium sufflavum]MCE7796441.1 hypothetical protein [Sphingobium sufflavum]